MGACKSTAELQRQHQEERRAVVQASPPLALNMKTPIQCQVDAHEAETVQELLESLAVGRFKLRQVDAEKLTLEFAEEPTERHRTLVSIGMCEQAGFSVLGVAEAQEVRQAIAETVDFFDAASKGRLEEVQLVCDFLPERVHKHDKVDHNTALIKASRYGHLGVVEALLQAKADVNAPGGRATALHDASSSGHLAVVEALLEAKADLNATTYWGNTALHDASKQQHLAVVEALLEAKADLNGQNDDGYTVLHSISCRNWRPRQPVIKALLEAKADMNARDNDGSTALQLASNLAVVQALLEAKADVNAPDKEGRSALHKASGNGHVPVVKALLEAKADVNSQNKRGETVLGSLRINKKAVSAVLTQAGGVLKAR